MPERPEWMNYLKPTEEARLAEIAGEHKALVRERAQIADRCRKRAAKAKKEAANVG